MKTSNYAALILAGGKGTELYPLTPTCTKSLLPIGNKKMIYYQIEILEQAKIPRTYILINNQTLDVEKQLSTKYKGGMQLVFVKTPDDLQTYSALNIFLNQREVQENLIVLSGDVVTALSLKDLLRFHQQNKSSFTFAVQAEEEKPKGKDKKKEENEDDDLKLFLVDNDNKVAYAEALTEAEDMGVAIHNAVLRGITQAKFHKVRDSHIYVVDRQVLKVVRDFTDEGVSSWASEFVPFLINNQRNLNLLKYTVDQGTVPSVPIRPYIYFINSFMKRVITIKDYDEINKKALIQGQKQIKLFEPTAHTDKLQEIKDMALISATAELKEGVKVRRSCVQGGVRLGKGVEIVNSIVLKNAVIEEGCKLYNCIVGPKCHIKKDCVLRDCQVAPETVISENTTVSDDVILNQQ